ncbi:BLUF domain-containing protein [Litorimonas haliclonae]|uniref:BLUF domain-containing protein n=1 Tax=Litorimonas haliclonae TaxID=2081977 RepID=UPI0039EECD5D
MELSQLIYTSTCTDAMTPRMAYQVSAQSVAVCEQLGLTGRVFANNRQALAMTEGPTEIVRQYFQAVSADILVEATLLHYDRVIEAREFSDYSVWLNLGEEFAFCDKVRRLTEQSVQDALPAYPSAKLRIMATAYLYGDMLATG